MPWLYVATKKNLLFIQGSSKWETVTFQNVSMFSPNITSTTGSFQEASVSFFSYVLYSFHFQWIVLFLFLFSRALSTYCRSFGSFVWIVLISSQTSWYKEISRWWQSVQFIWLPSWWSMLRCSAWSIDSEMYEIGS